MGLIAFLDFFAGDIHLAARSCGVHVATIRRMKKIGYVTPYVALCAQRIESMPYTEAGLCRFIIYEDEWETIRGEFPKEQERRRTFGEKARKRYHDRQIAEWINKKPAGAG